jgi:hypothetical protein
MPPLPDQIVSANLVVCEKVLIDQSGMPSIIQIIDTFQFQLDPKKEDQTPIILVNALFWVRFKPGVPTPSEHVFELLLERPDKAIKTVGEQLSATLPEPKLPDFPHGFNIPINFPLVASHSGTHYLTALLDRHEIARVAFSLIASIPEKQK